MASSGPLYWQTIASSATGDRLAGCTWGSYVYTFSSLRILQGSSSDFASLVYVSSGQWLVTSSTSGVMSY